MPGQTGGNKPPKDGGGKTAEPTKNPKKTKKPKKAKKKKK